MKRAFVLISGGLDSILAAKVIQKQGIEVIPLNFQTPFCDLKSKVEAAGVNLGVEIKTINLAQEFLKILKNPTYGFGSNMNPCIDCKIIMLKRAKELMKDWCVDFVITGEVLGQRPMSQHRQALDIIEKKSGLEGLILRPLSARLLFETTPEKEGWVNREKLLNISGRGRKAQIALAREMRVEGYPNPAGGCLLTDLGFSTRLKEIINNNELSLENIELLRLGRHFRIAQHTKLVVGRDEEENKQLGILAKEEDYLFVPQHVAGPTSLGRGMFNDALIRLACGITSRYCDGSDKSEIDIMYKKASGSQEEKIKATPLEDTTVCGLRI